MTEQEQGYNFDHKQYSIRRDPNAEAYFVGYQWVIDGEVRPLFEKRYFITSKAIAEAKLEEILAVERGKTMTELHDAFEDARHNLNLIVRDITLLESKVNNELLVTWGDVTKKTLRSLQDAVLGGEK